MWENFEYTGWVTSTDFEIRKTKSGRRKVRRMSEVARTSILVRGKRWKGKRIERMEEKLKDE